jgi:hypothetical protein
MTGAVDVSGDGVNDTSRRMLLPAVAVPGELHLAVDDRGKPVRMPFDQGRSAVFAYTDPSMTFRYRWSRTGLASFRSNTPLGIGASRRSRMSGGACRKSLMVQSCD